MTRLAAIDIGTNSTKMTIADSDNGTLAIVSETSDVTRLGAGVDAAKHLSDDAMTRTLSTLSRYAADARAQGVTRIVCAGTSALRDAANGPEFLARVQSETGLVIEIITGDREAELAYAAVHADPDLGLPPNFPVLVFDIGGGSTELTLANKDGHIDQHLSLDIGAVRITERFLHTDPPTDTELAQADTFIAQAFDTFPAPALRPILVGIGGTAVNIAAVTLGQDPAQPDTVHAAMLFDYNVSAALSRFHVPLAARREIPGLEPKRADVIIGGALILRALLVHFGSERFLVSARGLRYGLLAKAARA